MKNKECQNCRILLPLWKFKKSTGTQVKCPNCKQNNKIATSTWLLLGVVLLVSAFILTPFINSIAEGPIESLLYGIISALIVAPILLMNFKFKKTDNKKIN